MECKAIEQRRGTLIYLRVTEPKVCTNDAWYMIDSNYYVDVRGTSVPGSPILARVYGESAESATDEGYRMAEEIKSNMLFLGYEVEIED